MQFTTKYPFSNKERTFELKKSFMQNYKVMRVLPSGLTSHHGHNKSDKWLNVMTGKQCETIENQREFVQNILSDKGVFSRIDYQITVTDGLTVDDFRQWCIDGKVSGTLAESGIKSIVNDATSNSETTYIGDLKKRGKHGIFRCYDKAIQLNLDNFKITRFELEERQKRAQTTAKRYADGMEIGDIIRQRVDINDKAWIELCGAKSETLTRYKPETIEQQFDTTWLWLIETCAKTLGKKIASDEWNQLGQGNFDLFVETMNKAYNTQREVIINNICTHNNLDHDEK